MMDPPSSRRTGRRSSNNSSPSISSYLLQGFVFLITLYALGIILWQHYHISLGISDIGSIITSTKDAFVTESLNSRRAAANNDNGGAVHENDKSWSDILPAHDSFIGMFSGGGSDGDDATNGHEQGGGDGTIIPMDLSVNFLKVITKAPGAPPEPPLASSSSNSRPSEDFLPVVTPSEVTFRWAHRAKSGSNAEDIAKITSYQLVVRKSEELNSGEGAIVWDTQMVSLSNGNMPDSVDWKDANNNAIIVGQILQWRVTIWDAANKSHSSAWSKFAVGPSTENDWEGTQWIVHPSDMDTFDKNKNGNADPHDCEQWKKRRPLPLFRRMITSKELHSSDDESDSISSALLIMSGLGSFRASFDGVPLTTSGPIDPPFTDYSKRVMYRGFDVTSFLSGDNNDHAIGVTMGSGWWDHRPVSGMAKPKLLPRGPATVIAQLFITYTSGKTRSVGQTGADGENNGWQVSRGHIRESDLFTGEMVDLGVQADMEGWDTSKEFSAITVGVTELENNPYQQINKWTKPVPYITEVTGEERKQDMAVRAKALGRADAIKFDRHHNVAAPIGKLVPHEIPPVMAMERIPAEEIHDLGGGRWLLDYGKAFSGMLHFDDGVPTPIVPDGNVYPRAHGYKAATAKGGSFITVIYGESLEMTTGDINRVLTAGLGLHDGGPRHVSKKEGHTRNSYCFPDDHDAILSQKDIYIVSKSSDKKAFSQARQSHFTTHSFRFAEVCCSAEPPKNAHALLYRTAVDEWGTFDSSNVNMNGGYELVKNAMASNMLSVQSDCPHREKLPYGGDLVADSPAAMHMYDMSSFYKKTVNDWLEAQWDNGAYTETSVWQDLNDYAGIGHGAGETVWATAPPVLTVRHMQHYGDTTLLQYSLESHVKWIDFLDKYFEAGMHEKGYDDELDTYNGQKSGLGDWLAMRSRDTYLTHTAFYMAAGRCVAYIARKVGMKDIEEKGMAVAKKIQDRIVRLYLKNGKENFDFPKGSASHTPGPELSLFSKIVPGEKRCVVLKNWFRRSGHSWPGDEERKFLSHTTESDKAAMVETGELSKRGNDWSMGWSQWQGFNEGIFAIRYAMKTLSDMGFHNVAVRKAVGFGFATPEYMMRHNATTMWESWWRSEDLYSRNHPMLGAVSEWMATSAAGVGHYPTTTGSKKMLFWPRFPKSATYLAYASATQGTIKGDYSIAWRFEDLPEEKSQYDSAVVKVRVRFVVPPGGEAVLRPLVITSSSTTVMLSQATTIPDLCNAKTLTKDKCTQRRKDRLGFPFSWEYDRFEEKWHKHESGKSIGTPCESFLFHSSLDGTKWGKEMDATDGFSKRDDIQIEPGMYELVFTNWQLEKEVEGTGRIGNIPEYYESDDQGPYCKDSSEFEWNIDDATHII